MAKRAAKKAVEKRKRSTKKPIEFYDHKDKKRANNPPAGLVLTAYRGGNRVPRESR